MSSSLSQYRVGDVGVGARFQQGENNTWIEGIRPELLPAILKAVIDPLERLTKDQNDTIAKLEGQLCATTEQVLGFFRIIGEANVSGEEIGGQLIVIAERYKALLAQATAVPGDDHNTARLKAELRAALEKSDLERADALLAEIQTAQDNDIERRVLQAAATSAQRGDLAMTRLRYREAAAHFAGAAARVCQVHQVEQVGYLFKQAAALYFQGHEFGDNAALEQAIRLYRDELLPRVPCRNQSHNWAETQNNLGNALSALGHRERGIVRLEEAVAAYRAALEEWTRDQEPLAWAIAQTNLGNALTMLGERESGTARLEEAVAAYRAVLQERMLYRVPLQWAATQNGLGTALKAIGERESGTARLEEAVAAYRSALEEWTRDRVPLQWAALKSNIGNALLRIGERESGTARLEEAVAAYRAALEERTRERVPPQWAITQNSLGTALRSLAERESGTARLEEAAAAYRAALEEWTREQVPLRWAIAQNNIGIVLSIIGEREGGTMRLEQAVVAYDAALEIFIAAAADQYIRLCRTNRHRALLLKAKNKP